MKRIYKNIIGITCSFAVLFSCTRFDEQEMLDTPDTSDKIKMTITAVTEDCEKTKTSLSGAQGDALRRILWQPKDSIRVFNSNDYYGTLFTNTETEETTTASFTGDVSDTYISYAIYPYNNNAHLEYWGSSTIYFDQPSIQKYKKDSFNSNSMPMVAKETEGNGNLYFYSLAGVLSINLTGNETIKAISFTGYDESGQPLPVAGTFYFNLDNWGYNIYSTTGIYSATLDCERGVQLSEGAPTSFFMVLPTGTYSSFTLGISTTDGKFMLKQGTNPLTIRRANVTKAGVLEFVEEVTIDLSQRGVANCYIAETPGFYSFDANVIGNGNFGLIEKSGFHTTDVSINPTSVTTLWDQNESIDYVTLLGDKICFNTTGNKGNALIAANDANGNILWSWHIWVADQPQEQVYSNGTETYTMLDRNIGALRADRGTGNEWKEAIGLYYQWGRKDPMAVGSIYTTVGDQVSIEQAIANPTTFYGTWYSRWNATANNYLWTKEQKTIYDPCPIGYRVPTTNVWDLLNINNISGNLHNGADFIYDGVNTTYYPTTSGFDGSGSFSNDFNYCYLWSAEYYEDNKANALMFEMAQFYYPRWSEKRNSGWAIRCMKDENHVDILYPNLSAPVIENTTSSEVSVSVRIADESIENIVDRGFVWGTAPNPDLSNGNIVSVDCDSQEFEAVIGSLEHSTKYYLRAFATNSRGTGYSKEVSFHTLYSGDAKDLSATGTANCYIVPQVFAEYSFDASVKGNSSVNVGDIASADILWESRNDNFSIGKNTIIEYVKLEGTKVLFGLPFVPQSGNAVIAVKDEDGTILWSWHIWVTDYNPVATQQTLKSGAVIMDRNLGATSVVPGSKKSYGLYYQWGRKDPFLIPTYTSIYPSDAISLDYYDSSNDTMDNAVKHPCVIYDDAKWNEESKLWDCKKTEYDPCPEGWRVSDNTAWVNLRRAENSQTGYFQLSADSATPTVYIPTPGFLDGSITNTIDYDCSGYIWTTNRAEYAYAYIWNNDVHIYCDAVDFLRSVRCMKDNSGHEGGSNDYIVDDEYIWD